jgi:hypothetical protein
VLGLCQSNPAQNHTSPSTDSTAVGVCRRCNTFVCNTHEEFDSRPGILYCAPCVGSGGSSPPTKPGGGPGGPTPGRPRSPDEPPISFSSAPDAESRFPRFYRKSKAHADAFLARHNISAMTRHLAPRWEELFGERINVQDVDEELIAFGIGVTLWSAGLIPGELPEASEGNLSWLVRNRLLSMYLGELVTGA